MDTKLSAWTIGQLVATIREQPPDSLDEVQQALLDMYTRYQRMNHPGRFAVFCDPIMLKLDQKFHQRFLELIHNTYVYREAMQFQSKRSQLVVTMPDGLCVDARLALEYKLRGALAMFKHLQLGHTRPPLLEDSHDEETGNESRELSDAG